MVTQHTTSTVQNRGSFLGIKRISWAAIFGGALIALGIQLLLSLLGLGIGMGTIDPLQARSPMDGLGTGALIW